MRKLPSAIKLRAVQLIAVRYRLMFKGTLLRPVAITAPHFGLSKPNALLSHYTTNRLRDEENLYPLQAKAGIL